MADFLTGPKNFTFPLWKGQDTTFAVKRTNEDGEYINYDPGTVAKVVFLSGTTELVFTASITGSHAQFYIDDASVAGVKANSPWRLQFTIDGKDKTPVVGKVVRKDAR